MLEKGTPGSITMTSFDNNAFCTWTIQAPVGDRIKITVSSLKFFCNFNEVQSNSQGHLPSYPLSV